MRSYSTQTLLNAVTATTTSSAYEVGSASSISIQFIATGITSGNGVFTVQVSNNGIDWTAYNRQNTNGTNTITEGDTRVASTTLNSNTNSIKFFPVADAFRFIRVIVTRTTDGTYSAVLFARQ